MKITRRSAGIAGAVAAVAVSGALVAGPVFADANSTQTTTTSDTTTATSGRHAPDFDGDGPRSDTATAGAPGRHHGDGMGGVLGGPMLHSEGVVAKTTTSGTSYVTVRTQTGKVTAASDTAITVKSDDAYTKTWAIGSSTVVNRNGATAKGSAFAEGDVVTVSGTVDGDVVTTTFVGNGGGRDGRGRDGRGRGPVPSGSNA